MKKILILVCLLITVGILQVFVKEVNNYFFKPKSVLSGDASLENLVTELNKNLPYQIDSNIRMDSIELVNKTIRNNITVLNVSSHSDVVKFRGKFDDELKKKIIKINCSNSQIKRVMDMKIPVVYVYLTNQGREITNFEITQRDCY